MSALPPDGLPPMALDLPWLLALAVLAPAAWALVWRRGQRHRGARLRGYASPVAWGRLGIAPQSGRAGVWRLAAVMALLGVASAGPRWGLARTAVSARGIDMAIALDASLSMLAPDERPSRLERMKQEVRRLRAMAPADRVALIAFAGRSYVLTPLTGDDGALELFLDNLDPSVVGEAGSSLARSIRQGTDLLLASDGGADRALVVMSDGEAFEPVADIEEAAAAAGRQGIHLVAVGFGTAAGSTIPTQEEGRAGLKRDPEGRVVVTRYAAATLAAAARAAGGEFIPAEAGDKAGRVRRALRALRTARRAGAAHDDLVLRVPWFLLPAVLLLLWDTARQPVEGRRARGRHPPVLGVGLLAVLLPTACTRGPDPATLYESGDVRAALTAYRRAVAAGDSGVRSRFNLGTAYLANDSLAEATELLESARREADGEVRMRARFNAAVAALRRARQPGAPDAEQWLAVARSSLRALLRERPTDQDAKWNYELALRTPPPGGGGGGSGGGGSGRQPSPESGEVPPSAAGGLDARQAEALLNSAAREERDVQGRRQPRGRVPPTGKDW